MPSVPILGAAPTAPTVTAGTLQDVTVTILWNDNNVQTGRPASLDLQLYYALQKDGKTYVWNADTGEMEEAADSGYRAFDTASAASDALLTALYPEGNVPALGAPDTTTSSTRWSCTASALPQTVTVNGTQYTVAYGAKETTVPSGYVFVASDLNRNDGTAAALTNTLKVNFSATLNWLDAGNAYNSRPTDFAADLTGHLTLYRYVAGNPNAAEAVTDADGKTVLQAGGTDGAVWTITAADLPQYDPNGNPYVYYVQQQSASTEENILNANKNGAGEANSGDVYTFLYDNIGTYYATDSTRLYNGGTLDNTLYNTVGYTVNKVWDDAENTGSRPACTLYLYRVAATVAADGSIIYNPQEGSPVSGHDSKAVPVSETDGSRIPVGEVTAVTIADTTELPKYDADGNLYVYYTIERGLTGDYQQEVKAAADGKTYTAQDAKGNALTGSYLLNGGTLTNRLKSNADLAATKTYQANAMQSLDPDNTSATFKLQSSTDNAVWADQTGDDGKTVTVTLGMSDTGTFRPENTTVTDTSIHMPKYDAQGNVIYYRWVETGMKVNGATASTTEANGYADGTVVTVEGGALLGTKEVAPGVNGKYTTAKFKVQYNSDGSITNILQGSTQVKVTKVWSGGTAPDADVTLTLYRDGKAYAVNGSSTITLTKAEDWTALLTGLPRYDADGSEYTYTVEETGAEPAGWSFDSIDYTKTVVTEDGTGNKVTQTAAQVVNAMNPGESLTFDVEKAWLDDSDLLSRKAVTVGLYQKQTDGTWKIVTTAELNEGNLWQHRFSVAKTAGVTANDFVVMETKVGDTEVQNPNLDAAKTNEGTFTGTAYFSGRTVAETAGMAAGTVGVLAGGASRSDTLNNQYYVYVGRGSATESGAAYTVYNQRFGVVNLKLTKTWLASGEVLDAGFTVSGSVGGTSSDVLTFTLGNSAQSDAAKGIAVGAITTDANNSNQKSQTVTISGLPKYDASGRLLSYTVRETTIGGVAVSNGRAVVNSDTYLSTVAYQGVDYAGDAKHRTGDLYTWAGSNVRQETYALTVNKLWQDDGSNNEIARPDVRFTVYRTTAQKLIDAGLLTTNSTQLNEETEAGVALLEGMTGAQALVLKNSDAVSIVSVDNLWNTTHNQWYWSCSLGKVERYDDGGNPYIYFLLETMSANTANYQTLYYNGTDVPQDTGSSTAEVFAHSCADSGITADTAGAAGGYGNVLVVADGISATGSYDVTRYSRTTVNYRQKELALQGKKLWHFPSGVTLSSKQLPEVSIYAYRSETPLSSATYTTLQAAADASLAAGNTAVVQVNSVNLNASGNGIFTYKFTTDAAGKDLQYYDSYGRRYYYYVAEKPVNGYPELKTTANTFTFTNTYSVTKPWVEISLQKNWVNSLDGQLPGAQATFTLYAECQDAADGSGAVISGTRLTAATGTLTAAGAGNQTLVFGGTNQTYAAVTYQTPFSEGKLPYYGPNGKPYRYTVEETAVPSGYTVTVNGTAGTTSTVTVDTSVIGNETYAAAAQPITDTYTGDTTSYTATKAWSDGNRGWVAEAYRPSAITFTLHREKKNGSSWAEDPLAATQEITANAASNWTAAFKNLKKYDANGNQYKYYVTEALPAGADADQTQRYSSYTQTNRTENTVSTTGTVTNTLETVSVKAVKDWKLLLNNTGTPAAATEAQLETLRALGALPSSITFTVQYLSGGTWTNVKAGASGGDDLMSSYDLTKATVLAQLYSASAGGSLKWSNLPKYEVGYNASSAEAASHLMQYRVSETVTFADKTSYTVNGTDTAAQTGSHWTSTAAGGTNYSFTFTNTLPVRELLVEKTWNDGSNQDGLRPSSISFTLTRDNDTKTVVTLTLTGQTSGNQNSFTTGLVYVPLYQNASEEYSVYSAAEQTLTGYTVTVGASAHTAGDPLSNVTGQETNYNDFKFTNTSTPLTTEIQAAKNWAGDDSWKDQTRPDTVYLQLQYKTAATSYTAADAGCGLGTDSAVHTATAATNWETTGWTVYKDLVNAAGVSGAHPLTYRVVEVQKNTDGTYTALQNTDAFAYTVSGGTPAASGSSFTATLTNTLKTTTVRLRKVWADANGTALTAAQRTALAAAGALPAKLRYTLYYQTAEMTAAAPVSGAAQQVYSSLAADLLGTSGAAGWSSLPVYRKNAAGAMEQVNYTVREEISYDGSTYLAAENTNCVPVYGSPVRTTDSSTQNVTATLTTTNRIALGSVTVNKAWQDENNRDGKRPAEITLQLLRDGAAYGSPVTVSAPAAAGGSWSYTWADLPVYQPGSAETASVYTVLETKVGDKETAKSVYTPAYDAAGTAAGGTSALTVTNSYSPDTFTVSANKAFADTQNGIDWSAQTRPADVWLTLQYRNAAGNWVNVQTGSDYSAADAVYTGSAVTQRVAVDANPTGNHAEWEGLRAFYLVNGVQTTITYRVVETDENGSIQAAAGYTQTPDETGFTYAAADADNSVAKTIGNTLATTSLTVTKTWNDTGFAALRPTAVYFRVQYQHGNSGWTDLMNGETPVEITVAPADKTNDAQWTASLNGLPRTDRDGNAYRYRAYEAGAEYAGHTGRIDAAAGSWDNTGAWTGSIVGYTAAAATAAEENGSWETTAVNTLETGSLQVTKTWLDGVDRDGQRPDSITVSLYRDPTDTSSPAQIAATGTLVGTKQLTAQDGWAAQTWTGLPLYRADTALSRYMVVETAVSGYSTAYGGMAADAGKTLTSGGTAVTALSNTHTPVTFALSAAKAWEDNSDRYGQRPAEVTLTLTAQVTDADGVHALSILQSAMPAADADSGDTVRTTASISQTVSADNNWQAGWSGLPVRVLYNGQSLPVQYNVTESGQGTSYTALVSSNITSDGADRSVVVTNTLTGTVSLAVQKNWDAASLAAGTLPDSVQVQLQSRAKDGSGAWADVTENGTLDLTAAGSWYGVFTNLREDYAYRAVETGMTAVIGGQVTEVAAAGLKDDDAVQTGTVGCYRTTSDTQYDDATKTYVSSISNALITTQLRVDKTWAGDDENAYGTRPDYDLTVRLQRRIAGSGLLNGLRNLLQTGTAAGWEDVTIGGAAVTQKLTYDAGTGTWQTALFEGLAASDLTGAAYEYRAVEATAVPGYTSTTENDADGHTAITNTLASVSLTGTKTWQDYGDRYGARPASITLTVSDQNGSLAVQPEIVWTRQADTWTYRIEGLPQYLAGTRTPAVYQLTEAPAAHYQAKASAVTAENGQADFTNVLVMPLTSLTIIKHSVTLTGEKLSNASYILTRSNENGSTGYYAGTDSTGAAVWSADRSKAVSITTGADGTATVKGIPYGVYAFIEVAAPAGHDVDATPISITVNEANRTGTLAVEQADPLTPVQDQSGSGSKKKTVGTGSPRTGDPFQPAAALSLGGLSCAAGFLLMHVLRKKRRA